MLGESKLNLQARLAGWRAREEMRCKCKGHLLQNSLFSGEVSFCSIQAIANCMVFIYMMEGNLLDSKFTD